MIKIIFSCMVILLMMVTGSKAQILQHYTIFPMNRIFFHPAYAGIEARKAAQVYFQYIGFDNNINIYSFQKNHNIQYYQHKKVLSLAGSYETVLDKKTKHNLSVFGGIVHYERSDINPIADELSLITNSFGISSGYTYRKFYNEYRSLSYSVSPFITFFTYENSKLSFIFGSGLGVWYQSKGFRGGINLGIMSSSAGGFSPKIDLQSSYNINTNLFNFAPVINVNIFEEGAFDAGIMISFLKKKLSVTYLHNLNKARNTSHEFYISTYYGTISIEYKKAKNLSLGGAFRIPRNNIEGRYYRRGTSIYANPISFELTARYRF